MTTENRRIRRGVAVLRRIGHWQDLLGLTILALGLALAGAQAALAHGYEVGAIEIGHPWARATPPGARVGGGYLALENEGDTPDRLVSVTTDVATKVEIHEMAVTDGVMTMRPLAGGLAIPAKGEVKLAPGGYHLMLMGLKQPLVEGEKFKATLTFEHAGPVEVEFVIEAMGAGEHHGEEGMAH